MLRGYLAGFAMNVRGRPGRKEMDFDDMWYVTRRSAEILGGGGLGCGIGFHVLSKRGSRDGGG